MIVASVMSSEPDEPAPIIAPYAPPETVRLVTVEDTEPVISKPALTGLVTVISSNEPAAHIPPISIPFLAPVIVPELIDGVPDSRT